MSAVIDVQQLTKSFGRVRALDGLDLTVESVARCTGSSGPPNGAGKSTTLRVLLGLLRADGGSCACSAPTRGPTPSRCTAGSPTSRAT
ncbi:hypothetical protein [Cellulomonas sp. NS3]|uniref:hypothetical protein n=1 Tax=Cellulomonas sp. NS3 TaxID=2973977 RepID=UPI0037C0D4D1